MNAKILGVIAITSTMSLACTMTETRTTEAESTDPASSKPVEKPADSGWRSKLTLSRPGANAAAIAALSAKVGAAPSRRALKTRSGGGGGASCGLSTGDATCDTCLDTSCCAPNTACVSDADCTALVTCGDACRDDACLSGCMTAHPTGAALLDSLSTCVGTSCATACGGGSSGPPTSACGFGTGAAACDSCLDTNCCGDANACLGDADCTALIDCAQTCSDSACEAACESAHPAGTAKMTALSTCANTACGGTCGGASSGPGPGPASCGLTSGVATCDTCLDASCCAPTSACLGDADCTAIVGCYDACSDAACAAACDAAHPTGSTKLTAVFTCVQTSCASPCGF